MPDHLALADYLAMLAAALAAGMGLRALSSPEWTSRLVRLTPDPARREGRAELRAIYGGLYSAGHLFVLAALALSPAGGAWAAAAVGAGWLGSGVVRFAFMGADGARTRYNALGAAFEVVMGLALAAPLAFG